MVVLLSDCRLKMGFSPNLLKENALIGTSLPIAQGEEEEVFHNHTTSLRKLLSCFIVLSFIHDLHFEHLHYGSLSAIWH